MITPAFSPTATERVLPRLALDFTTGVLDPRVTVTRALNTATRVNSSGFIESVNANLPRFDYDPVTLAAKGLLIEETRANQLLRSQELNNPAWGTTGITVSADATTAPDNTLSAERLTETAVSSAHFISQASVSAVSGSPTTLSFYVKKGTLATAPNFIQIYLAQAQFGANAFANYNISTGVMGNIGSGSSATITNAGNGWYRCTLTVTATATATATGYLLFCNNSGTATLAPSYLGSTTSDVFVWGAQSEAGAFATSYIPTTTTSVTRNADVVQMTGTNFSSWFNGSEGTFTVQFDSAAVSASATALYYALAASNGTASNFSGIYTYQAAAYGATVNGGAGQANINGGAVTVNATQKVCYGYKANSFAASLNGAAANLDGSGTIPTVDRLTIGGLYSGANLLNGHVAKVAFYTPRLINNEIRAFSK